MRHHYEPRRWHAASARVRKTAIYGPAGQIGKFINYLHLNYLISPFFFSLFGPRVGTEPGTTTLSPSDYSSDFFGL